jgi:hypothetical protein
MAGQMYIIEARTPDGALKLDLASQPPFNTASERQLFEHYNTQTGKTAYPGDEDQKQLVWDWFESRGWTIRPRNW